MFLESLDLTCMCFFFFSFFFVLPHIFISLFFFFIFGVCWLFTLTRILVRTYCDHEQKLNKTIDSAADIDTSAVFFLFEDAKSLGSLSAALNWGKKKTTSRRDIFGIFTTSILTIPPDPPHTCVQRYMPLLMFSPFLWGVWLCGENAVGESFLQLILLAFDFLPYRAKLNGSQCLWNNLGK